MRKESFKRKLSLIVMLVITFVTVMGGFQYGAHNALATNSGIKVHFYKPSDWNKVNVYYYNDRGEAKTWPGDAMKHEGGNWYEFEIKSISDPLVIFTDGAGRQIPSSGQSGIKTTTESWYKDGKLTTKNPEMPKGDINIHVEKPDSWDSMWIWYDSDLSTPQWDTTTLKSKPGDMVNYRSNWYSKRIVNTDKVHLLFNDGTWNRKLDNKGGDFEAIKDIWITKDGKVFNEDPYQDKKPVSLEISGSSSVNVGDQVSLISKVIYDDGTKEEKNVSWSINDSTLGELSNTSGKETKITSLKSGKLIVKASLDGLTANKEITIKDISVSKDYIKVYFKSPWSGAKIYHWGTVPVTPVVSWPGTNMTPEGDGWYSYTLNGVKATNLIFNNGQGSQTGDLQITSGEWYFENNKWTDQDPRIDTTAPIITESPKAGNYEESTLTITLTSKDNVDQNSKIYYTVDGTNPTVKSQLYTNGVLITKDTVIKAIAVDTDGNVSSVYTLEYKLNLDVTAPVVIADPSSGRYMTTQNVRFTITDNTDKAPKLYYSTDGKAPKLTDDYLYTGQKITVSKDTVIRTIGIDVSGNKVENYFTYNIGEYKSNDFREESIYFVMTTRFYDGDPSNNVHSWDDIQAKNPDSDPAWRGDFKGLMDKLDYVKALGFSAIWVTPPVKNASGYDYHGYHAVNFSEIDPRYKTKYDDSAEDSYQKFIDAAHAKGMKVIQDVVFNHTSNFGEENLFPMFKRNAATGLNETIEEALTKIENGKLPINYDLLTANLQYAARIDAMKEDLSDTENIYHHEKSLDWEGYSCQTGQIAGDCVDLNTENPYVANYLVEAHKKYINMGVDAFRIDTIKHISRLTLNNEFIPQLKAASAKQNYLDNQSVQDQPRSDNAVLRGNSYHTPDRNLSSGLEVIDFPMHWNFANARDAFGVAVYGDSTYNDATWNVVYVDSHDYAPDTAPENQRFALGQDVWAENLSLMFTFRGVPCVYYGSEIEFQKGKQIDVGPNAPLSETMCAEAKKHGIRIIVDVVANHFTRDYNSISQNVKNIPNFFRTNQQIRNWGDRREVTQLALLGLWDINTHNPASQEYVKAYLQRCVELGASGFRYDAAKHIELPDDHGFGSNFWPIVLNNGAEFQYGEVLQDPISRDDAYASYMSLTASNYGMKLRDNVGKNNFNAGTLMGYDSSVNPDKLVTWVESHDTYANALSDWGSSQWMTDEQIKLAWAVTTARAEGTPLFFSRPVGGGGKNWDNRFPEVTRVGDRGSDLFMNDEIVAVNKFRNAMNGESENLRNPNNNNQILMIERGAKGLVIVNGSYENMQINTQTNLADGNYTNRTNDNSQFTVSNGTISGRLPARSVIVLYKGNEIVDPIDSVDPSVPTEGTTFYFEKPDNWGSNINAYIYDETNGVKQVATWPGVSMVKENNNLYSYALETDFTNPLVIFTDGNNQVPGAQQKGFELVNEATYDTSGIKKISGRVIVMDLCLRY